LLQSFSTLKGSYGVAQHKTGRKTAAPALQVTRLLDQIRDRFRYIHYNLKTVKTYLYWIRFIVHCSATQPSGMSYPKEMGMTALRTTRPNLMTPFTT
jgi:hypothetical protein